MYMCKCVGAYVYMRVCMYMYARTYVTMYVCMYACMYVLIHTCVHACMYCACFVFKITVGDISYAVPPMLKSGKRVTLVPTDRPP